MKFLQKAFDSIKPHFEKGGKWEKFHPVYDGHRTIVFSPDSVTKSTGVQARDAMDLKRLMMTVIIAMIPCLLFGIWNTGYQYHLATGEAPELMDQILIGLFKVLPIVVVSYGVGLTIEFTFCVIKGHAISEGFLVSGMLIPLVMPATIPLWQVAIATAFAVIIAKEAFGGTGMNILNVALTARAFLYFAYPSQISGEVWTYLGDKPTLDGYSGATPLAVGAEIAESGADITMVDALAERSAGFAEGLYSTWNLILGAYPGSIGATSVIMCAIGALVLIATRVGSWKTIVSCVIGGYLMGLLLNVAGSNAFAQVPAYYHLIMGGFAFGAVFMATDPVSSAQTETGKWIYGFLIGVITVIIRVLNPAYPEGIMLAILFMNVFAPLIDFYVVEANKKRRLRRATV